MSVLQKNLCTTAWKNKTELKAIRKQGNCRNEKSSSFEAEAEMQSRNSGCYSIFRSFS
jgi:hypothetical protein